MWRQIRTLSPRYFSLRLCNADVAALTNSRALVDFGVLLGAR
jgi:hypothetical protein